MLVEHTDPRSVLEHDHPCPDHTTLKCVMSHGLCAGPNQHPTACRSVRWSFWAPAWTAGPGALICRQARALSEGVLTC